jgi:hypothetical protein
VFGPTRRPNEPVTAGAALGAGPGPQYGDPDSLPIDRITQALYAIHPSPVLARMMIRLRNLPV